MRGSYTVELSLLMPLIIGVFWLIISMGFYVYDCSLMEMSMIISSYVYEEAVDSNICNETECIGDEIAVSINELLTGTLCNWNKTIDVKANEDVITIEIEAYTNKLISVLPMDNVGNIWSYNTSLSKKAMNEWEFIMMQ